jgi:hypothetical protein
MITLITIIAITTIIIIIIIGSVSYIPDGSLVEPCS